MTKNKKKKGPKWNLFFYHVVIFIIVHFLFVFLVGVIPLSELGSHSYLDYILEHFINHSVNIYQNETINHMSNIWKTILIIHFIVELIETLFPPKQKTKTTEKVMEKRTSTVISDMKKDVGIKTNMKQRESGTVRRAWVYLIIAGLLEIIWATALKMDMLGGPLLIVLIISFDLLIRSVKQLGVGTSYAIFTGIGVVGMVIVDFIVFQESLSMVKIGLVILLVLFIIGLRFSSEQEEIT